MSKTEPQRSKQSKQTDHDILVRIEERLNGLILQFTNHLAHHDAREIRRDRYTIALLSITGGAIVSLVITLITLWPRS